MQCLFCGSKIGYLRKLSGKEFCSDEHEQEHLRRQEELALARLMEAAFEPPPEPEDDGQAAGPEFGVRAVEAEEQTPELAGWVLEWPVLASGPSKPQGFFDLVLKSAGVLIPVMLAAAVPPGIERCEPARQVAPVSAVSGPASPRTGSSSGRSGRPRVEIGRGNRRPIGLEQGAPQYPAADVLPLQRLRPNGNAGRAGPADASARVYRIGVAMPRVALREVRIQSGKPVVSGVAAKRPKRTRLEMAGIRQPKVRIQANGYPEPVRPAFLDSAQIPYSLPRQADHSSEALPPARRASQLWMVVLPEVDRRTHGASLAGVAPLGNPELPVQIGRMAHATGAEPSGFAVGLRMVPAPGVRRPAEGPLESMEAPPPATVVEVRPTPARRKARAFAGTSPVIGMVILPPDSVDPETWPVVAPAGPQALRARLVDEPFAPHRHTAGIETAPAASFPGASGIRMQAIPALAGTIRAGSRPAATKLESLSGGSPLGSEIVLRLRLAGKRRTQPAEPAYADLGRLAEVPTHAGASIWLGAAPREDARGPQLTNGLRPVRPEWVVQTVSGVGPRPANAPAEAGGVDAQAWIWLAKPVGAAKIDRDMPAAEPEPAESDGGDFPPEPEHELVTPGAHKNVLAVMMVRWNQMPDTARKSTMALPIIALLALIFPRFAAQSEGGTLATVQAAVRSRAAIDLNDDFRAGLSRWDGKPGWALGWRYDAAGFLRPGRELALLRDSIPLKDYHLEFLGQIEKKALNWVVRASNRNTYYGYKLLITKPGPLPAVAIVRYAMVDGREVARTQLPLPLNVRSDTMYQVRTDVRGSQFTTYVNGQLVDTWSDQRLASGGVGFFSERAEVARLRWVRLTDRDDAVGKMCSYLSPQN